MGIGREADCEKGERCNICSFSLDGCAGCGKVGFLLYAYADLIFLLICLGCWASWDVKVKGISSPVVVEKWDTYAIAEFFFWVFFLIVSLAM